MLKHLRDIAKKKGPIKILLQNTLQANQGLG